MKEKDLSFMKKVPKVSNLKFDFSKCASAAERAEVVNKVLSAPVNPYEKFISSIENQVPKIPNSTFRENLERDTYWDFEDFDILVCDDIGNNNLDVLFQNPSSTLKDLQVAIQNLFQCEIYQKIQDQYPLSPQKLFSELKEDERASFAALCTLIRSNNKNNTFLPWLAHNVIPPDLYENALKESNQIKKVGVFEKHKTGIASHDQYWAILLPGNEFQLLKANGEIDTQFKCDHIDKSRSGNSLRVWKDKQQLGTRLVIIYDELLNRWIQDDTLLPCFFPYSIPNGVIPEVVARAFYEMIMAPDTVVLRAMLHHQVFPVDSTGMNLVENLFTIFASKEKVHRLISSIAAVEFSHAGDLQETMVLRGNSHLTCLFKFFAKKYGQNYFQKVIKPVIDEVAKRGDVNITPPSDESKYEEAEEKVKSLIYFGIDKVLQSAQYIPDQFRHIASILKICTSQVLRSKHATFNALSSFMFLRFFTPAIVSPGNVVQGEKPPENSKVTTVPFSRIIQLPFNLQQIPKEKYPHLQKLNEKIFEKYADIYNFAMDVAEYNEAAKYEKTTEEDAINAIKEIITTIAKDKTSRITFIRRINDLSESEDERSSVSFLFGNILTQCFEK